MFAILMQHKIISGIILILFLLSNLLQIVLGHYFAVLIRETENMASTDKELLRECKRKFANCYRANAGVLNVSVFADKFIHKIEIGKIRVSRLRHLSGQLMLLSVFTAGVGACKGIIEGETLGEILPFYIISLFGLYIYFSVSGAVDLAGQQKILKTNMVDYLENNMINKLSSLEEDLKRVEPEMVRDEENQKEEKAKKTIFTRKEEKELEDLLREFLT